MEYQQHERPLRVPSNETPRFWNRDASTGFAIANIATLPTVFNGGWTGITAVMAGLVGGGMYGKHKQQQELRDGKLVHPPTYLNKNTLIGISDGIIFGSIIGILTGGTGLFAVAGLAAGLGFMGSRYGYHRMKHDYDAAKQYVSQYGEFHPSAQQGAAGPAPTLMPNKPTSIHETLEHNGGHVARLEAETPTTEQLR